MKQTVEILNVEDAIDRLSKATGKKVIICTIDFDKDEETQKTGTKEEGYTLIRNAKTIICDNDDIVQHLGLFSILQKDINHMLPSGTMHDIMFCIDDT